MLVEEHYDENEPVVDIETGENYFCLKKKILRTTDFDQMIRYKCLKFKLNRFGMSMGKVMKRNSDFEIALHDRIAPYFNLYKQFINFMTYFMVAHRSHISMFDILRGKWTDMKTFKDTVRYLAVKKRNKKHV